MLNSSFQNVPLIQDQIGIDARCPLPVEETIQFMRKQREEDGTISIEKEEVANSLREDLKFTKYFPTSSMFLRQSNFYRMDLESLFFSFYYQ